MKKRGFKLSIDSYIINFSTFFKPNFSSENYNFSGISCLHGKVLIFETFCNLKLETQIVLSMKVKNKLLII